MKPLLLILSLVLGGMLSPAVPVPALGASAPSISTAKWKRYCNARFGQCAAVPPGLTADPPPENGDGRSFASADGFQLTISAINNVLDDTVTTERETTAGRFSAKPLYERQGRDWFVLSGVEGERIYYIRRAVRRGTISGVEMSYPAALRAKYDPVAAAVAGSFKPAR